VIDWLKEVKQHASTDILIYLIGNRCDLEDEREVTRERAIEFCKQYNIDKFFETSAKTGDNVEEVFSIAAKELYVQAKEQQLQQQDDDDTATGTGAPTTDQSHQEKNAPKKLRNQNINKKPQKGSSCC
jgi:GTPase SAR1 family protein